MSPRKFGVIRYVSINRANEIDDSNPSCSGTTMFRQGIGFRIPQTIGNYDCCTQCGAQFAMFGKGSNMLNYCPACGRRKVS